MAKINLTPEEKAGLIEAINKGTEPKPDLLPKLFPGTAEKFDVQALDRAKIPTLPVMTFVDNDPFPLRPF